MLPGIVFFKSCRVKGASTDGLIRQHAQDAPIYCMSKRPYMIFDSMMSHEIRSDAFFSTGCGLVFPMENTITAPPGAVPHTPGHPRPQGEAAHPWDPGTLRLEAEEAKSSPLPSWVNLT